MSNNSSPASYKTPLLSTGLFRHIIDNGHDAVLVVDASTLTLVEVNLHACQMLGYAQEELLGKALSSVECSLLDVFFWEELAQQPLFKGSRVAQTEWLRIDDSVFFVEKKVSSYAENGQQFWVIHAEDLTRSRDIEQQQLHLISQLQSSLESTAEGILAVDLFGHVVNVNRRFGLMWSLPEDLLLDQNEELIWDYIFSCLEDMSDISASLERVKIEPHLETEDYLTLTDGRSFICVSKPEFVRDSLIGRVFSVRDITSMKKIEIDLLAARDIAEQASLEKSRMLDALRVSESRLRRLVNSSLIGIMQGDLHGGIVEANDVLLALLGISRKGFIEQGLDWHALVSSNSVSVYEHALVELNSTGQTVPFEVELTTTSGHLIPCMVGLSKLEGSATEWVAFVLDLTKQHESDRIKSDFISMVSHELRTPLTSIHGSLGLLESGVCGPLLPNVLNLVRIAYKNSQRLGNLVNDLLDMEKLANGKMVINLERVNLVALINHAIEANTGYAQTFRVSLRFNQHPEQAWAMGDSNRLMQVFANLFSNAIKFSYSGGVVEIKLIEADGVFRVEVKDHGQGIADGFKQQIFKKFSQADNGDTRRQGGTGLGLNITQSLVEKMGGEIGFESQVGVGTVFWITVVCGVQRRGDVH